MKIAVISATVLPACEPDDPLHTSFYGSEMYNAVLVRGLADAGHELSFFAPVGSSTFREHPRIKYHAIKNSRGAHLDSELLEDISLDIPKSKTTDLLDYDFIIDMSKQNHITEELALYHGFKRFVHFKSGYQDWVFPTRITPRFVTHCQTFADNFKANGFEADVARFGLSDFWCRGAGWFDYSNNYGWDIDPGEYFLFPHRPVRDKGIDTVLRLARLFKDETFVISTAAVFEDHIAEMARVKAEAANLPNVKFISCPQNKRYHFYRRALVRNAKCLLSLFSVNAGYLDTGGLVSFEAIRCGTPVIVTESQASKEMLGELEDKGVVFCDGFRSALLAIRYRAYEERPKVDNSWMSIDSYVSDYERIMKKFAN